MNVRTAQCLLLCVLGSCMLWVSGRSQSQKVCKWSFVKSRMVKSWECQVKSIGGSVQRQNHSKMQAKKHIQRGSRINVQADNKQLNLNLYKRSGAEWPPPYAVEVRSKLKVSLGQGNTCSFVSAPSLPNGPSWICASNIASPRNPVQRYN